MSFIVENEQTMLLELLEIVENLLGIEFSPSEHKVLFEYMKSNPNADPKKILGEILALAEKKLNKKVTEENKREIDSHCRNTKILERMANKKNSPGRSFSQDPNRKNTKEKLRDEEIKRIVDAAEKKLVDKKALPRKLDEKNRELVEKTMKDQTNENETPVNIANRAILEVSIVGIAGAIQNVVLQNLGNPLIPILGSFANNTDNNSIINQANAINFSLQDSMGTKCHAVVNLINSSNMSPDFLAKLDRLVSPEALTGGAAKSIAPVPSPYSQA